MIPHIRVEARQEPRYRLHLGAYAGDFLARYSDLRDSTKETLDGALCDLRLAGLGLQQLKLSVTNVKELGFKLETCDVFRSLADVVALINDEDRVSQVYLHLVHNLLVNDVGVRHEEDVCL